MRPTSAEAIISFINYQKRRVNSLRNNSQAATWSKLQAVSQSQAVIRSTMPS